MAIPLCKMVPMSIVRLIFKIDILKMKQTFHMGYKERDKVFICFLRVGRVRSKMFFCTMEHGMNIGLLKINNLKRCYGKTLTWCTSPTRCFCVGQEPPHPSLDAIH